MAIVVKNTKYKLIDRIKAAIKLISSLFRLPGAAKKQAENIFIG
jgi:hypothetical protein